MRAINKCPLSWLQIKEATSSFVLSYLTLIIIATFYKHCAFTTSYILFENLSLLDMKCGGLERPEQLSMAASIQAHYFFMVVLHGKACDQHGHSAHYCVFQVSYTCSIHL